jgi:hypothetical protein
VVVGGSDFAFGFRTGALDAAAAADGAADGAEHHHFPFARRQLLDWRQDADGRWSSDREDEHLWEVLCAECGDTDGPAENQAEPVRRLSGPYAGGHKAKHVATRHFEEN